MGPQRRMPHPRGRRRTARMAGLRTQPAASSRMWRHRQRRPHVRTCALLPPVRLRPRCHRASWRTKPGRSRPRGGGGGGRRRSALRGRRMSGWHRRAAGRTLRPRRRPRRTQTAVCRTVATAQAVWQCSLPSGRGSRHWGPRSALLQPRYGVWARPRRWAKHLRSMVPLRALCRWTTARWCGWRGEARACSDRAVAAIAPRPPQRQ
mmetsp:Transcript_30991/g.93068  ORF Transcript_30991/g.93068 Transcript_30991/m.93068 type:complete len:206 (-) Transcript_30991:704-1321(-)